MIAPGHLRYFTITLFTVVILFVSGLQGAGAQESETGPAPQPEAATATPEKPEPETDPCAASDVAGKTWLDQTHDFVAKELCAPAA